MPKKYSLKRKRSRKQKTRKHGGKGNNEYKFLNNATMRRMKLSNALNKHLNDLPAVTEQRKRIQAMTPNEIKKLREELNAWATSEYE